MKGIETSDGFKDFVISSGFFKGFYFSACWNQTHISLLQAGQNQQTSKVVELASNCRIEISSKINSCGRLYSLLEALYGNKKFPILPMPTGTPFQLRVWQALRSIPYGQTRSYKQIADKIGNPNAARAVGAACGKNPILLVIPCHRVITSAKTLGGFSAGFSLKKTLLEIEGVNLI